MGKKTITNSILYFLVAIFYTYMVVIAILQVVLRYFGVTIAWAEESARYAFVWVTFLGIGYVTLVGEHLDIQFILNRLQARAKKIISIVGKVLVALFLVFLLKYGIDQSLLASRGTSPGLGINMLFVYAAVPVMVIFVFIASIEHKLIVHRKNDKKVIQ